VVVVDVLSSSVGRTLNTVPYSGMRQVCIHSLYKLIFAVAVYGMIVLRKDFMSRGASTSVSC